MARRPFSGTPDAYVIDAQGVPQPGRDAEGNVLVSGTAWTAQTSGTQVTDLLAMDGSAMTTIVPDQTGRLPRFLGPDNGRADLWLDFGAGRFLLLATDHPDRILALETGGVQAAGAQYPATAVVYSSDYRAARPATNTGQFTWTCDGVSDQNEINDAILAVTQDGGGKVLLLGGDFHISGSIVLRDYVHLQGQGPASTKIKAASGFSAGMVTLFQDTANADATKRSLTHLTKLSDLTLDGRSQSVHGVHYLNNSGQGFPYSSPDPSHTIQDLYITDCGNSSFAGHGMWMQGANLRAGKYSKMRINGCSGTGVWVDASVDSNYTDIEIGSIGNVNNAAYSTSTTNPIGHGFFVRQGDNNVFTACKAWYCRGAGFFVQGTRNNFVGCTAQDNYSYGYHLHWGKNSYLGCHADSNGQVQKLTGDTTGRGTDGFFCDSDLNQIVGCMSYDRQAGSNNWRQQYGFRYTGSFINSRVTGCITFTNNTASTVGTVGAGTTTDVRADGTGK